MHFAISEDDKLYLGEHAVPAGSEVLTQVFRTYLQGKGFDEDSLVKPIQRGIVERTKRQGFSSMELLRIKKDESAYFFPMKCWTRLPSRLQAIIMKPSCAFFPKACPRRQSRI